MNLGSNFPHASFDDLLVSAATWLLVGSLAWLAALFLAVLVEALTDGRWQPARFTLAPLAWRRALLAVVVPTLAACGLSPAHADPPSHPPAAAVLEGLQLPSRPSGDLGTPARVHVVRPGESLWVIARAMDPHADDAQLTHLVGRLHRQNRTVIGADPDQLRPGERLALPTTDQARDNGGSR